MYSGHDYLVSILFSPPIPTSPFNFIVFYTCLIYYLVGSLAQYNYNFFVPLYSLISDNIINFHVAMCAAIKFYFYHRAGS